MSKVTSLPSGLRRRFAVGVEVYDSGVHCRLWAPKCNNVSFVSETKNGEILKIVLLEKEVGGYFSGFIEGISNGSFYRFKVDESPKLFPDPVSRYQPLGPEGPSQIVDSSLHAWEDMYWKGLDKKNAIIYEMHVGTFTIDGTWVAAIEKLQRLASLGITCIEIMPVSDFPGKFNWGYDGVNLFAPSRNYGTPEDFREFVDRAHSLNIAVILDVVYNHFGPQSNYLTAFSDSFFSEKSTDWGNAINFDGEGNFGVREFFLTNACYWVDEFHIDGFRIDATQNIYDTSALHILKELRQTLDLWAGEKRIYLVGENEPQDSGLLSDDSEQRGGLDALWNDDFHHSCRVALTGRNEGYFLDYAGTPQELLSAIKWGFLYQGQNYLWQRKRRGRQSFFHTPCDFVHFIQNHDQIANYGNGTRIHNMCSLSDLRAITTLLILGPQTPMIFQGQEFASSSPFYYFGDFDGELGSAMEKGRKFEASQFPSHALPSVWERLKKPSELSTFMDSKLNHDEVNKKFHSQILLLHKDLIKIRKSETTIIDSECRKLVDGAVLSENVFVLRYFSKEESTAGKNDRLLIINLGNIFTPSILPEPLMAAPDSCVWECYWSSEDPIYGGTGAPQPQTKDEVGFTKWNILQHSAMLLRPKLQSSSELQLEEELSRRHEEHKKAAIKRLIDEA